VDSYANHSGPMARAFGIAPSGRPKSGPFRARQFPVANFRERDDKHSGLAVGRRHVVVVNVGLETE
jgi:hypothetical protein